jgi:hypothetical protein
VLSAIVLGLALAAFLRPSIVSWWGSVSAQTPPLSTEKARELVEDVKECKARQDRIERVLDWQITVLHLLAQKSDLNVPPPPFSLRGGRLHNGAER